MSTPSPVAERNLIFGLLALQMDFVTREQLLDAMSAWMLDKQTPLGEILCRRGVLDSRRARALDALVEIHVEQHGNPQASLAALRVEPSVRRDLGQIDDPEVQASLAGLPAQDSPATGDGKAEGSFAVLATTAPVGDAALSIRYRRLREHAKGGLGEVFVALDEELDREVALKEIQSRHADHPESRARFLTEARVTGALEHPGIVPVYGLGVYPDGRPYYAMRFIKGDSLRDAIEAFHAGRSRLPGGTSPGPARQAGPTFHSLAFRQLLRRFVDVCNAISYAHSRGVIHRDLKPANVMLGKFGETLVVDWGLAKVVGQADGEATTASALVSSGDSALTQAGQALGTPAFMSPEQAAGRLDRVGPASDTYSLGATLYCLLTGKAPFTEKDVGVVLAKVQKGDFKPPRQVHASVPRALQAVCLKAMGLKPQDRYSSPRELAEEIEHWLADEPVKAYPESRRARLARWGRRHKPLVAGAAALLLTAVVALSLGLVLLGQANREIQGQKRAADEAKQQAEKRRDTLAALNDTIRRAKYIADMNLAQHAWAENNLIRTRELLEQHRPKPGETDLRGFEWHYLRRFFHRELRTVQAHYGVALGVAFTPDGKRLITSGCLTPDFLGAQIKLWDAATLRRLPLELKGPTDKARCIALSRDGKLLAAGCIDKAARVWNLDTGDLFTLGRPSQDSIGWSTVNFSPDGKRLVCRFVDPSGIYKKRTVLGIWNLSTRKSIATIEKLPGSITLPTFSPDGKYVAIGFIEQGVKAWEVATGCEAFSYKYREDKIVFGIGFSLDGKRLAVGGTDGIHIIDVATQARLAVWPTSSHSKCLAVSPDGRRLATGSQEGFVELWDFDSGQLLDTFRGHTGYVEGLAFSPDGAHLASVGVDGSLRIWDTNAERAAISIADAEPGRRYLELGNNDQTAITGIEEKTVRIWSAATGQLRAGPFEHQHIVLGIDLTQDGKRLIVADKGKSVRVWDVGKRTQLLSFKINREVYPFAGYISQAGISPDGTWYALPAEDGRIELWNLETGALSRTIKGFANLRLCRFSPDGSRLLGASVEGTIKVWDMPTGQEITSIQLNGMLIIRIRFSPDGKLLAVTGNNRFFSSEARIVALESGREVMLKGHRISVLDMAFSPDGRRVATASADKTVGIWDLESGQEILILKGHTDAVLSLRFSSDGRRLISASADRTVRIWDATPLPE